jgi:hypothetical protein
MFAFLTVRRNEKKKWGWYSGKPKPDPRTGAGFNFSE